jgi:zinc protease
VQRFDDVDYGGIGDLLLAQLFPAGHPYHGGRNRDELNTITLDELRQFGRQFYVPSNASLTLSGDFDSAQAVALMDRYFGSINPGRAPISPRAPTVELSRTTFLRIAAAVPLDAVMLAWPTPGIGEDGDADLDVLAYTLQKAILPKALMSSAPLASEVWARQYSQRLASFFIIEAKLQRGISHQVALDAMDAELQKLRTEPLGYVWTQTASSKVLQDVFLHMETATRRAARLNRYSWEMHDPGYLNTEIDRYRAVNPKAVQTTARWELPHDRRVVAFITADPTAPPGGRLLEVR